MSSVFNLVSADGTERVPHNFSSVRSAKQYYKEYWTVPAHIQGKSVNAAGESSCFQTLWTKASSRKHWRYVGV